MEICLNPYFLSPGDDMCFTHYESPSPFLSPKAKGNERIVLTDSIPLDPPDSTRHTTSKICQEYIGKET